MSQPPRPAAPSSAPFPSNAPPRLESWQDMREWAAGLLLSRTGADVATWNRRVAKAGPADERALREWLAGQGVTGYAQALVVWERFGYPEFLNAGAEELVAGQYADRPRLRPVLDAVLAILPELGTVTVQARKTYISLVGPRRTFAVVQATTKNRVDLGLRLDGAEPGGRLQAAKNVGNGAFTVRVALTGPGDVDEQVRGWLRLAYDQNAAPPETRRPARRPAPVVGQMTVVLEGFDLPGRTCQPEPGGIRHVNVHVALTGSGKGRPALTVPGTARLAIEPLPGDAAAARWEFPVTVKRDDDGFDFAGPFVRGDRTDRHFGLVWGDVAGDGTLRLFRGTKFRFADIDPGVIERAMRPGYHLSVRYRMTDANGNPACASIRPPLVTFTAEPA